MIKLLSSKLLLISATILCSQLFLFANIPVQARTNLALHKPVFATPAPNGSRYEIKQDVALLTDGKITPKGKTIWNGGQAIAWHYAGRMNIAVDLGQPSYINELAIRMRGGKSGPGWFQVVASQDGKHWTVIKNISRFDSNYRREFARLTGDSSPQFLRSSNLFLLRFKNLDTDARWIGLRMMISRTLSGASDELYVYGHHLPEGVHPRPLKGKPAGFSIQHPQPYFTKPYILLTTNVVTPLPIGIVPAAKKIKHQSDKPFTFTLDIPKGLQILGGRFLSPNSPRIKIKDTKVTTLANGGHRYQFKMPAPKKKFGHGFGRLYVEATGWKDGQKGAIHYQFGQGAWQSKTVTVPVRAVTLPKAPRLKHIMVNLGWWFATDTTQWPDALKAFKQIGLNTFPIFGYYRRNDYPDGAAWKLLEKAREQGFFISNIDSTFMRVVQRFGKTYPQMLLQTKNGRSKRIFDPSYRGKYYKWAIQRFARTISRVKPDFTTQDVEMWYYKSVKTFQQSPRMQRLFAASGYKSWEKWLAILGDQIWGDAIGAARKALKKEGAKPFFDTGIYSLRPDKEHGLIQNFSQLYPEYITQSEPYIYAPYYAPALLEIAKKVRHDRKQLPKSDVMPWLTPGNAGTYPASTMQWALLESYTNGARGVWFWNGKLWDGEDLIAINRVVRAIAPVEDIIVKGNLIGDSAKIVGKGHISGMKRGNKMVFLASDYYHAGNGQLQLKIKVPQTSKITDLITGKVVISKLAPGWQTITLPLNGQSARLLWLEPVQ